jgi:hypothetical protein
LKKKFLFSAHSISLHPRLSHLAREAAVARAPRIAATTATAAAAAAATAAATAAAVTLRALGVVILASVDTLCRQKSRKDNNKKIK